MTAERAAGGGSLRRSLALRLVAGFVGVAIAAVMVSAGLTLWRNKHEVGKLASDRHQATAEAIATTLGLGYRQQGAWERVDVHPAMMLAAQAEASMRVYDKTGAPVSLRDSMAEMMASMPAFDGPSSTADVMVDGQRVGSVRITFASNELVHAERHVRDAMRGSVLLGSLLAVAVALAVSIPLSRRVVQPLRRVTQAATRIGQGDSTARVGHHDATAELGELAVAFDDMADRLAAHETSRRNVTADIAHELRTPLTILQGNCEEIIDGITEPTLERFVQMHDDVLRLGRLVDDLRVLADADTAAAQRAVRAERCDLAVIAAQVVDGLASSIDAHQHRVTRELGAAPVMGERGQLGQIVANVLTNAIKYTPPGGHIRLHTETNTSVGTVLLRIADDGPGIAAEDRPHVFERFYRASSARSASGSGIGLAVVAQLVQAHGGTVRLADAAVGTCIEVTMPRAP